LPWPPQAALQAYRVKFATPKPGSIEAPRLYFLHCLKSDSDSCFVLGVPLPTLYVRNVPDDLYRALRKRARAYHRSIAAEVLNVLEENVPTAIELKARQNLLRRLIRTHTKRKNLERAFPSTEEMLREDRAR